MNIDDGKKWNCGILGKCKKAFSYSENEINSKQSLEYGNVDKSVVLQFLNCYLLLQTFADIWSLALIYM